MTRRERIYRLTLSRDGEESEVLVRAWSADEAETSLKETLKAEGRVRLAGRVVGPARQFAMPGRIARRGPESSIRAPMPTG